MVEKGVPDEVVLDELDGLFALLAAQRRGEMLFAEEMAKPDDEIDFVRAAMYIAMHRRADLSRVEDAVEEIDQLARELETRLPRPEESRAGRPASQWRRARAATVAARLSTMCK